MFNTLFFPFLGVFFITKTDGNVDVWDLLDRFVVVKEMRRLRPVGHLYGDVILLHLLRPESFRVLLLSLKPRWDYQI